MSRWVIALAIATGCSESPEFPVTTAAELGSARVLTPGCSGSAYATVQAAIAAAVTGDIVEVCSGTYRERLDISAKNITLRSRSGAAATIIDGTGGQTIKIRNGAVVTVQGLTIRNGSTATGTGGNVYCGSGTVTLRGNVIENGHAMKGGGYGTTSCPSTLDGNTFRFNTSDDKGGGLYSSKPTTLTNNRFEDNAGLEGGGGYVMDSNELVRGNTFLRNYASDDGGGFMIYRGSPLIDGNHFEDNESDEEGGGLRIKSASPTITNNVLVHNTANWRGGGSKISHDEVTMSGNVWDDNRSYSYAGALLLFESASLLQNETFVNNESDDGGAVAIKEGWGSVTIEDSTFEGNVAEDRGGHLFTDLLRYNTRLRRVDMVGGEAQWGGAVYATSESRWEDDPYAPIPYWTAVQFENTLFEDNVATVSGGALYTDEVQGWLKNDLIIGNAAPDGSGIVIVNGRGGSFDVLNTIFRSNTTGAAISKAVGGSSPDVKYNDFNGNSRNFSGMTDLSSSNGNRTSSPSFVDEAGGDYHLSPGSSLVDRGDPAILDKNGTRSDIGLYGGPNAE